MSPIKYSTDNTSTITPGQFVKTVAATGTPEKIWAGAAQVFTVQTVADSSGSLRGTYFDCYDSSGRVRVYFTVASTGTIPPIYDGRLLVVNFAANATANTIATAINAAMDADAEFVTTVLTDTVTVTQVSKGERGTPVAGTSGFTVGVSTAGVSTKNLVPSVSLTGKKARGTDNTGNVWFGTSSTNDAQLVLISSGDTKSMFAPEGGSIDLGTLYLDVANNGDGVVVSYPAMAANQVPGSGTATSGKQDTGNTSLASIDTKTPVAQYSGVPSNFAVATADGTVFTLAAGEVGFIQNLDSADPLAVKKGASASTSSFSFILSSGTAQDDGKGGAVKIDDWIGVVSVATMSGTGRYIAYKQAP